MAFTDPQSVTINAVATSLPRVTTGENSAGYRSADGFVDMQISHTYGRRNRHRVRLHHSKVAADPLSPALNRPFDMSINIVIDVPDTGYSAAEQKQIVDAMTAYLTASSGANVTKILGGES
nr:MAG: hypothetical protein 2 [Leviviridae sp.]